MKKISGIYKISCIENKKFYIGSAVDIANRWHRHKYDLRANKGTNPNIQASWNKYGEKSFAFEIIEEVLDKSKLTEREQYYFDTLKPALNACPIAGNNLGVRFKLKNRRSKEHCLKISLAAKERLKIKENNGMYGKKHRKESIELMKKNRPSYLGEGNPFYGKKHSIAAINKMSLVKKGKRSSRARLSDDQVRHIRNLYNNGNDIKDIADEFSFSVSGIKKIVSRGRYADVI